MVQWAGIILTLVLLAITIVIGIFLYREERKPQCTQDSECPAGGVCINNMCVPKPCSSNTDCPNGQVCVNGQCLTQTCSTNSDCPQGDICSSGICILSTTCTSDSDCPMGQICNTTSGMCEVDNTLYVKDIIAQTSSSCPSGYTLAQGYGTHDHTMGNADLKQGTGTKTPDVYLCLQKSPTQADAIQDVIVFQFGSGSEKSCPDPYNRMTYQWENKTQYNYSDGCEFTTVQTKLCSTTSSSNILKHGPIQDIMVTITDSCPTGYQLGAHDADDDAKFLGADGNINFRCGGESTRLCIK